MKKDKSWVKLAMYFAGELSPEELKKMESWIKADSDREEEINRLYEIWKESESLPYELDVNSAWVKVYDGIDKIEECNSEKDSQKLEVGMFVGHSAKLNENFKASEIVWRRIALVAATILIVAMAGFFSFYTQKQANLAKTDQIENRTFITKNGERATYILNDGSKVMLHAGSRLEIPDDFNKDKRVLFLEGEAYFEVNHNKDKPFIVESENAYTRVLGTRFLVQAWPEANERVEVVVSDGRVALGKIKNGSSDTNNEVLITKNKIGVIGENLNPVVSDVSNMNWYIGWIEGKLEFENRPLSEVLPRLERWYNIDIRVEDESIVEKRITAEVDYSHSMSEVIQGIALTLELEVDREDRTFTFRSSR